MAGCLLDWFAFNIANIDTLWILGIIELISVFLISYKIFSKNRTNFAIFSILFMVFVPPLDAYLFCIPQLIAIGRMILLMALMVIGYFLGRRNISWHNIKLRKNPFKTK